jgi:hypothetical protein
MIDRESWFGMAMADLADTRAAGYTEAEHARGVVERLAELLGPAEAELLLVGEDGRLEVTAASTGRARELSLLEVRTGVGPCTECYRTGRAALNQRLAVIAARWPELAAAGRRAGFRSVSTLPMRRHGERIGVVGLLGTEQGTLDDGLTGLAQLLVEAATIGILQRRAVQRSARRAGQLQQALDNRVVIEQAKGVLAAVLAISPEIAFGFLRNYARRHNLTLTGLAGQVVRGELAAAELTATPEPGRRQSRRNRDNPR